MRLPLVNKFFSFKTNHFLAVDLGTALVQVAIFQPPEKLQKNPKILGQGRQKLGLTAMRGGEINDFDAVLETLSLALDGAQLYAGFLPHQAILGLGGSQIKSIGITVRIKRQQPEKEISSQELDLLGEKIETQTLAQAYQLLKQLMGDSLHLEHIGTYFTGYLVDGAQVETPLGINGETLQIQVLYTFATPKVLAQTKRLANQLDLEIKLLIDSTLSLTSQYLEKSPAGIMIDLRGQTTNVVIFRERKILGNLSFNLGEYDFTQAISRQMNLTFDEAEKIKSSFTEGHLDTQRSQMVLTALEPVLDDWRLGLETTLRRFRLPTLPETILLTGEGDGVKIEEIHDALTHHPWQKTLPFNREPRIQVLEDENPALKALTKAQI